MSEIQRCDIDWGLQMSYAANNGRYCRYSDVEPLEERITKLEEQAAIDKGFITQYQMQVKALAIDRDTWMGKYTDLRNAGELQNE